ncbi:TauD/TfdA dioxygenase family protein [Sneathiella glossodoripedis]|uniref:TauD/TfdA dioxygenase family protein n=1 Tax=Sneathiella glossodoripedis TaxID=418853 RepID=UPI000471F0B6|nr:TauD/TfdA family dioxygenase [Sneathiella glossodoripedis]
MTYTHFTVETATPSIGAYIAGIDLNSELPKQAYDELKHALATYKVIFFRDQDLSNKKFHELGANMGNLEIHEFFPQLEEFPEIHVIQTKGGNTGTDRWHTDVTFRKEPSYASILRAIDIPTDGGGDTMWLSTHAAFEDLSTPLKELLLQVQGVHDMRYGMTGYLDTETVEKNVAKNPPMLHPAVISHPITGKPHLFINSIWTPAINGLKREESEALIKFLHEHVKKPEFQVRFKWQKNSIAIWDNIATQHYAVGDYNYPRVMNRMIVNGTKIEAYKA